MVCAHKKAPKPRLYQVVSRGGLVEERMPGWHLVCGELRILMTATMLVTTVQKEH